MGGQTHRNRRTDSDPRKGGRTVTAITGNSEKHVTAYQKKWDRNYRNGLPVGRNAVITG